ncbi:exonuclease III [Baia soyae]|uniref:Exonuclease III n=2 Tax=Baia soyae TaxID=1544746 RepID=A0A4R2RZ80_9BACL|nr:exonuclease III [Baia soyae]
MKGKGCFFMSIRKRILIPVLLLCLCFMSFSMVGNSFATSPYLSTKKQAYSTGEAIQINFNQGPGNAKDWIGIYRKGSANSPSLDWVYVNGSKTASSGVTQGLVTLNGVLEAGAYEIRFFANDGYTKISPDISINVTNQKSPSQASETVKIMSMNTWQGGANVANGFEKIVNAVRLSGADIVGFQEKAEPVTAIAKRLGWYYYQASHDGGVISKYPIVETFEFEGVGASAARVRLPSGQEVMVASAHLDYRVYSPYLAHFDKKAPKDIIANEERSRGVQTTNILNRLNPYLSANIPVFLLGDFNAPSHLDWVESTKNTHQGYVLDWPVSKKIEQAGMIDSYRAIHPDPAADPGNTWSPVYTYDHPWDTSYPKEPQDRIDFIYSKGRAKAINSKVFMMGSPKPYGQHQNNEWPTDHAAVVSSYTINP